MRRILCCVPVLAVAAVLALRAGAAREDDKPASQGNIAHMVYFKLKDGSDANRQKLVDACKKYLDRHVGTVYFSAGVIGDEFKSKFNDRDWDVALHLVFADKAAHDKYAVHPEHLKFIEENKDGWAKVRVFDSEIMPLAKKASAPNAK